MEELESDFDKKSKRNVFAKMKLRLIVFAVETLHNNMVNEWIFSFFLLIEFFCIGESAANLILLSLVPQIQIFDVYQESLRSANEQVNIGLNTGVLLATLLFCVLFGLVRPNKEHTWWCFKAGFKIMGFLISIYGSGLAVPFLFSNIKILACIAFDETYDCFAGTSLTLFILNVITLFLFLSLYYFYAKCLDLNYHIPVEHYQAPWSLLRPQPIVIPLVIHATAAITVTFYDNSVVCVVMQILLLLALVSKQVMKFRHCYFVHNRVNTLDVFLSSFLTLLILMGIIIYLVGVQFTYNSIYLVLIIALAFALALVWVHSFRRRSSLQLFMLSFKSFQEGIDAATNTIIDYLCSPTLSDSVKIKGLIQLIATMDDFDGAKQRRQAKTKKYLQQLHRLSEQENEMKVSPFASKDKKAKTYRRLNTARKLQAYLQRIARRQGGGTITTGVNFQERLQKFEQRKLLFDRAKFLSTVNADDTLQLPNTSDAFDLDMTIMNLAAQNDIDDCLHSSRHSSSSLFDDAFEDPSDALYKTSFNRKKDVQLILEVLECFIQSLQDRQTSPHLYVQMKLLKIRLLYLTSQTEKMHYLLYLVSSLASLNKSFALQAIAYIYKKKFQSVFKQRVTEKRDKVTPTKLVFYEHQREAFEIKIGETTESMLMLLSELRQQNTSSVEIQKRFSRAKDIIRQSMVLEKRFKTMTSLNAQQIDLVAMYFHFLDQVVHMENEARSVYKIMYDMNNAAKINRRFENFDLNKSRSTGFILVSGNFSNIGQIIKLNNTICNQLHYYKEDLIGKRVEALLPDAISIYHEQVTVNYVHKQSLARQEKRNKKKQDERKEEKKQEPETPRATSLFQMDEVNSEGRLDGGWHLTQKSKIHVLKSKQGTIGPFVCNFDIYFDIWNEVQFLCLIQPAAQIPIDGQKLDKSCVYIVQTQNFGIIQSCSQNFIDRYGMQASKLQDEYVDIEKFNFQLTAFNQGSSIDAGGIPLQLDFSSLIGLQSEESKQQIEKYHTQAAKRNIRKRIRHDDLKRPVDISGKKDLSYPHHGFDHTFVLGSSHSHSFYSLNFSEHKQICYVKREIISKKKDDRSSDRVNSKYINSLSRYTAADQTASIGASVVLPKQNYQSSEMNSFVDRDSVQAIIYYIVFPEGMTQIMRDEAYLLYEQLYKKESFMNREYRMMHNGAEPPSFQIMLEAQLSVYDQNGRNQEGINEGQAKKISGDSGSDLSEDQFTFASTTSSSTSSTNKDKITELKNETFLGQVPIFVSLFQKVFIFYFVLFVVVGTVILVVAFQSNTLFFNNIESINVSRELYADETVVSFAFRTLLNMANGLEPITSTLVDNSRVPRVYDMLKSKNNNVRTGDTTMLNYARGLNSEPLRDATIQPTIIIRSLTSDSNVISKNFSLDESLQLLTSKVQDFIFIVNVSNWNETKTDLYCGDCSFSRDDLVSYNQEAQQGLFSWSLIAREAYWIIENTDWYISNGLDILTKLFLNQASIEIVTYKQQVLILVVCCVGLAFLCSVAFIPNFLRMRRNLNLNIYLLEKMQVETIQQMLAHIQLFYKQLTSSRGVYGSKGGRHHRIPEVHYVSTDKVSQELGAPKKKKMILRSEKSKFKQEKLRRINQEMNQMSLENEKAPRKRLVGANQYTYNTYKTNEQLRLPTYNLDEEIKEDINKSEEDEKKITKSNQNKHESSSDEEDSDDSKRGKKKDKKKAEELNPLNEKEREVLREKRKSLGQMYFKQKLKSITISFTFSLVLSVFFITDYFLVSTTFDESVASVQMFQAYYQLQPCYISAIRLTREQLMKNETQFWIFGNFTNIAQIYRQCFTYQDQIRAIQKNYPPTLASAQSFLNSIDTNQYCSVMTPVLNVTMNDCNNDDGGIFKNGFDAALSTVMNYFYMQQLNYNSMDPELRTDAYLGTLLADPKSIDYMMTYIKYFDGTFTSIKAAVTGSFQDYYNLKTSQFSAVYSIFIIVLVVSILVILCFLMRSLQQDIYLARKTIQLIPHSELVKPENYDLANKIKY